MKENTFSKLYIIALSIVNKSSLMIDTFLLKEYLDGRLCECCCKLPRPQLMTIGHNEAWHIHHEHSNYQHWSFSWVFQFCTSIYGSSKPDSTPQTFARSGLSGDQGCMILKMSFSSSKITHAQGPLTPTLSNSLGCPIWPKLAKHCMSITIEKRYCHKDIQFYVSVITLPPM